MPLNAKHIGSSFDSFLEEQGITSHVTRHAAKRRLAVQFQKLMKEKKITKTAMAKEMKTSRMQLGRILSPENSKVMIESLERAAEIIDCSVDIILRPKHHSRETIKK